MKIKRTAILFPAAFLMNFSIIMISFTVIFFLKDRIGLSHQRLVYTLRLEVLVMLAFA